MVTLADGSSGSTFVSLADALVVFWPRMEFVQSVFSDSALGDETSTWKVDNNKVTWVNCFNNWRQNQLRIDVYDVEFREGKNFFVSDKIRQSLIAQTKTKKTYLRYPLQCTV